VLSYFVDYIDQAEMEPVIFIIHSQVKCHKYMQNTSNTRLTSYPEHIENVSSISA